MKNNSINYNQIEKRFEIFNKLPSGVQVFKGLSKGAFVIVYCNEAYLDFCGMSFDSYMQKKVENNFFDIHPDDVEILTKAFDNALDNSSQFSCVIRALTKNNEYKWVTYFGNFVLNDDKSITFYSICSDSNEFDKVQKIRDDRYYTIIDRLQTFIDTKSCTIYCNIDKNTYEVLSNIMPTYKQIKNQGSLDDLFDTIDRNIDYEKQKIEFQKITRSSLKENFSTNSEIKLILPLKKDNKNYNWYNLEIYLCLKPNTQEIVAAIVFEDIDKQYRNQRSMERIYQTGFDMVGHIDTKTNLLTYLKDDNENAEYGRVIDYKLELPKYLKETIIDDFYEESLEAFNLNEVLERIKNDKTYAISYPVKIRENNLNTIYQWKFAYIKGQNRIILITRNNMSRYYDDKIDLLTGLYNQNGFILNVKKVLQVNDNRQYQITRLDFDGFKLVNDEYGFSFGNRFLRKFARELKQALEEYSTEIIFSHFESDQFLFFSPVDSITVENLYELIQRELKKFKQVKNMQIRLGVYRIFDKTIEPILMCDRAYLALKSIKGNYTKHIEFFNEDIRYKLFEEKFMFQEMKDALQNEQFQVWFQPQFNTITKELAGAEALVRWVHPTKGFISPGSFIPLFEKNDFIYELDKYVLEKTCQFQRKVIDNGIKAVALSVNISRFDLLKVDFYDTITTIINKYDIPLDLIQLEITESAFSESTSIITKVVNKLIENGYIVAIDDFGSGYSSLSMLQNIPAHILKLDMSFFSDSMFKNRNYNIIQSVIKMAESLKMITIAEGVEEQAQADFLKEVGCNYIQGYLFSKPMILDSFYLYMQNTINEIVSPDKVQIINEYEDFNKSNSYFSLIVKELDSSVLVCDAKNNKVLFVNEAAEKCYNKLFDPRVGLTCYQFCEDSLNKCIDCPLDKMKSNRMDVTNTKKGITYHYKFIKSKIFNREVFIINRTDITKYKGSESSKLQMIENLPGALLVYKQVSDNNFKRVFISEKAQEILMMKVNPTKETPLKDSLTFIDKNDLPRLTKNILTCVKNKANIHEEFRVLNDKKIDLWVEVSAKPMIDDDGKLVYYCYMTDITENKNKQLNELTLQKRRYDIYKKMVSDTNIDYNEELIEKIEIDITDDKILSIYVNEDECMTYEGFSTDDIIYKISELAFCDKDRHLIIKKYNEHILNNEINTIGYISSTIEYLRINKSGRICWVRTELKTFIDPYTSNKIQLIMTYESGKKSFPEALMTRFISKDIEIISLYNLKTSVGQSYYLKRNYSTIDYIVDNQISNIVNYAKERVDDNQQEEFLNALRIDFVLKHLQTVNDVYRCSFWTSYDDQRYRKTWVFSYIDEDKNGLFITRTDTTTSYIQEEKEKLKLKNALDQIELSKYDGLTGLLNRSILVSKIQELIDAESHTPRAFLMIDLDDLKFINDTYGHMVGDKALTLLSETLRQCCEGAIVGRVGGDEFVVYYDNITSTKALKVQLENLLKVINNIVLIDKYRLHVSIGCVVDKDRDNTFESLYRRADRALYISKSKGKNCYHIYMP